MGLLELLGLGSKNDAIQEYKSKGAVIIDVRTIEEFKQGHINGSKNYPLSSLSSKISDIKKQNKPVIVCCQSGMRSSQAASILKNNNIDVINGGGWQSLESKL
jgi:rhodanese-related sulfurtransferase